MRKHKSLLRGITWQNPRGYEPLIAASRIWEQAHSGQQVEWEQQPWYQFEEAILQSLEQGDARYDLIMFDHPWVGKLAEENWLLPWDELAGEAYIRELDERVVQPSTESYAWSGHQWALPLDAASHAGLYREDLVDAESIPDTWEALEGWAKEHFRDRAFYPIVLSVEGVLGCCLFLSMMASLNAPAFHKIGCLDFNREAAERALECLCALLPYTPPDSHTWGPWDIYGHMCERHDIGYSPSIFAYVNYFGQEHQKSSLRLAKVPRFSEFKAGRPILGGVGLGVAHTCADTDFACEYGQFLMSEQIQKDIFPRHLGQPATRSLFSDPAENLRTNGFYTALSNNMASAYIRPRYKGFHAFELSLGKILQTLWNGEATISHTLDRLEKLCAGQSNTAYF